MWKLAKKGNIDHPHHHYRLVHTALRDICMAAPYDFFELMVSQAREEFLEDLWSCIRKDCDELGDPSFTISELQFFPTHLKGYPLLLVVMPEPLFSPEAYLVGVLLEVPLEEVKYRKPTPVCRYFTLEKSPDLVAMATGYSAVLCEWADGLHINHAMELNPDLHTFTNAISEII